MDEGRRGDERAIELAARAILEEVAAAGTTITYADLAAALREAGHPIEADDPALGPMLGRISTQDDSRGRGMLSAVVVRRDGGRPGGGFFRLAEQLGRDVSNRHACWAAELARVRRSRAGG